MWASSMSHSSRQPFSRRIHPRTSHLWKLSSSSWCGCSSYGKSHELNIQLSRDLQNNSPVTKPAAVVITRSLEVIACLKAPTERGDVFVIFDARTRPKHPESVEIFMATSILDAASHINDIFSIDQSLLSDTAPQVSGLFYAPNDEIPSSTANFSRIIMESSVALLSLRAQLAELQSQNSTLENRLLQQSARHYTPPPPCNCEKPPASTTTRFFQVARQRLPERSRQSRSATVPMKPVPSKALLESSEVADTYDDLDMESARLLQYKFDFENLNQRKASTDKGPLSVSVHDWQPVSPSLASPLRRTPLHYTEITMRRRQHWKNVVKPLLDDGHESFVHSCEEPADAYVDRASFECGICLEPHYVDEIATVEPCDHSFCRACARQYVQGKLRDQHYPILCPVCQTQSVEENEPSGGLSHTTPVSYYLTSHTQRLSLRCWRPLGLKTASMRNSENCS